ncbi:MAG: hypothetical protein KC910_06260 [Candidatus Eremiobacteraeota bacterium]|nr:hypothetical protein [Candidatus Eremiobacteraeota bacterium]
MAYKVAPKSLRTAQTHRAAPAAPAVRNSGGPQPKRKGPTLSSAAERNEQPSSAGQTAATGLADAYKLKERDPGTKPGFSETRERPGLGTRISRTLGMDSQGDRIRQDLNNTQAGPRDTNHSVSGTSVGTPYDDHITQNFGGDGVRPSEGEKPNTALSAYGKVQAGDGDDVVTTNSAPNITGHSVNRTSAIDLGKGKDHFAIGDTGNQPGTVFYNGRPLFDLTGDAATGTHNYDLTDNPGDAFSMSYPQDRGGHVYQDNPLFTSGRLQLPDSTHGGNMTSGFFTVPAAQ